MPKFLRDLRLFILQWHGVKKLLSAARISPDNQTIIILLLFLTAHLIS